jgi:hypothetical protein
MATLSSLVTPTANKNVELLLYDFTDIVVFVFASPSSPKQLQRGNGNVANQAPMEYATTGKLLQQYRFSPRSPFFSPRKLASSSSTVSHTDPSKTTSVRCCCNKHESLWRDMKHFAAFRSIVRFERLYAPYWTFVRHYASPTATGKGSAWHSVPP